MAATQTPDYRPFAVGDVVRANTKAWFARLQERADAGEPYVLGYPNAPHELFEALDIPFMVDAWYSGLVAAKQQSGHYSRVLEDHGYHSGLSRYMAMPFGVLLDDDRSTAPWGGLPAPALVVTGSGEGNGPALAAHYGVRHVALHTPAMRRPTDLWWDYGRYEWEAMAGSERIDLVVAQYHELIAVLEAMSGRRMDYDRLGEIMARVNEQENHFLAVRDMVASAEKLPVRLGEATTITMGIQWHRGVQWAVDAAKQFRDEVALRIENREFVCPGEKHRLMWLGTGLWQNQRFLDRFEREYDTVFVRSNYLSLAADGYVREGLHDPLRALASRYAAFGAEYMHQPGPGSAWHLHEARTHRAGGAVLVGQWWGGSRLIARDLEAAGIPVTTLDADSLGAGGMDMDRLAAEIGRFIQTEVAPRQKGGQA